MRPHEQRELRALNPTVASMSPSATLAVAARAKALKRQGRDIIELSAGEPDFDTPPAVVEAAHEALRQGYFHYTPNPGLTELREAIAEKLRRENGLDVTTEQVLVSNGAKQSVAQAILATCGPGDEVLIPSPYWVSYPDQVRLAGATPVVLETTAAESYVLSPEKLAAALRPRTRMFILNSPNNPTGIVYTPEEIAAFAAIVREHPSLLVLSDEIYEHVVFETPHVSIGALEGMAERTLTVNGFSKSFAMTGWRLGYLAGPKWAIDAADTIQSQLTSGPNAVTQRAGIAALAMDKEPLRVMVDAFRKRHDFLIEAIDGIDGVVVPKPEGAFYLFPDVGGLFGRSTPGGTVIRTAEALCTYLIEEHGLALVPGEGFGAPRSVRISYASSMEEIAEGAKRFRAGVEALR